MPLPADLVPRAATLADIGAIGALHAASWRETYAGLMPERMLAAMTAAVRTAMWDRILRDPGACGCEAVFVVAGGGGVVGFGSCGTTRDPTLAAAGFTGEFSALYVSRSWQNRGIGRSLMGAMARTLCVSGRLSACLWVLRDNHPARLFYEAAGGSPVGERIDAQPDGDLAEVAYGWRDLSRLRGVAPA